MSISCGSWFGYGQLDPLDQALTDFLKDEVEFPTSELTEIHNLLTKTASQLKSILQQDVYQLQGLDISNVTPSGLAWDPKFACKSSQFDLLVVFKLGCLEEQWTCVKIPPDGSTSLIAIPYVIRRKSPDLDYITVEYKSKMATYGNKLYFNEVHYDQICPVKFLHKTKEFIKSKLPHLDQLPFALQDGANLTINIKINEREIRLNLIPTLDVVQVKSELSVGWIWTSNILNEKRTLMLPDGSNWRRCYVVEDNVWKTAFLRNKSSQVLTKIYKILITIINNQDRPLSKLNPNVVKTFLATLSQKYGFCYNKLALKEAFKMFIMQLEETIKGGVIQHIHEPGINILRALDPSVLQFLSGYLKSVQSDHVDFLLEHKVVVPQQADADLILLEQALLQFHNLKSLKVQQVVASIQEQLGTILEGHFNRDDIANRISIRYHSVVTGNNYQQPKDCRIVLAFRLDGGVWLPKSEHDPEVLEDDFQPYHCTWAKYTDDFKQNNQALKYGKEDTCYQMDSCKFTSTINGEINSAINNFYFQNDVAVTTYVFNDRVEVKVKLETLGRVLTFHVIPAVCFVNNSQIPDSFMLVNANKAGKIYWKRNYDLETQRMVGNMDEFDRGCRLAVLEVLLQALLSTPMSKLDGDVFVTAVVNNRHHHGWSSRSVAKMLKFILDYLVLCLADRVMVHHLESIRNVLKSYAVEDLELCTEYLRSFKASSFKPSSYHFLLYREG